MSFTHAKLIDRPCVSSANEGGIGVQPAFPHRVSTGSSIMEKSSFHRHSAADAAAAGRTPCASRGFTLIELAIVAAILIVLLSLALPALQAARRNAAAHTCLLNARTCTMAVLQYATDHKEILPYRARSRTFLNAFTVDGLGMDYSFQTLSWPGVMKPYLDSAPIPKPTMCPAAYSYWKSSGGEFSGSEAIASYNLSYGLFSRPELWNSIVPDAAERWLAPVSLSDVSFPDRKSMLVEAVAFHLRSPHQPDAADRLLMLEIPPGSTRARPITLCDGSARNLDRSPLAEPYSGPVGPGFWFHFAGIMTERGARGMDLK